MLAEISQSFFTPQTAKAAEHIFISFQPAVLKPRLLSHYLLEYAIVLADKKNWLFYEGKPAPCHD